MCPSSVSLCHFLSTSWSLCPCPWLGLLLRTLWDTINHNNRKRFYAVRAQALLHRKTCTTSVPRQGKSSVGKFGLHQYHKHSRKVSGLSKCRSNFTTYTVIVFVCLCPEDGLITLILEALNTLITISMDELTLHFASANAHKSSSRWYCAQSPVSTHAHSSWPFVRSSSRLVRSGYEERLISISENRISNLNWGWGASYCHPAVCHFSPEQGLWYYNSPCHRPSYADDGVSHWGFA